jgi:hypothetical protein
LIQGDLGITIKGAASSKDTVFMERAGQMIDELRDAFKEFSDNEDCLRYVMVYTTEEQRASLDKVLKWKAEQEEKRRQESADAMAMLVTWAEEEQGREKKTA